MGAIDMPYSINGSCTIDKDLRLAHKFLEVIQKISGSKTPVRVPKVEGNMRSFQAGVDTRFTQGYWRHLVVADRVADKICFYARWKYRR
jgi:hypothetical protein